jgi:hypothetical protein
VVVAAAAAVLAAVTTFLAARNPNSASSDLFSNIALLGSHALQALRPLGAFASQLPGHFHMAWQHIWLWVSSTSLLPNLPPSSEPIAAAALSAVAIISTAWYIKKQQIPGSSQRISPTTTPTTTATTSKTSSRSTSPSGPQPNPPQTTPPSLEQQLQAQQQFSQRLMGELQQINAVFQQLGAQLPPPSSAASPPDLAKSGIPPLVLEVRARLGSLSRLLQEKTTLLQQMSSWSELQVQ